MRRSERALPIERVAHLATRLAVLIEAGVAVRSAWGYLQQSERDATPTTEAVLAAADRAAAAGKPVGSAVLETLSGTGSTDPSEYRAWAAIATAWSIATVTGAPLAPALKVIAGSLRELAEVHRAIDISLVGPAATSRLVLILPVVGLLLGAGLGMDPISAFASVPGAACLVAGVTLMALAALWTRRMVRRATSEDAAPGLLLDLLQIGMRGGAAPSVVRDSVGELVLSAGLSNADDDQAAADVFALAESAGVASAQLLHGQAAQRRRVARTTANRRAETLGVQLMVPLGLCVLPAFLLLAVAPVLLSALSSTLRLF